MKETFLSNPELIVTLIIFGIFFLGLGGMISSSLEDVAKAIREQTYVLANEDDDDDDIIDKPEPPKDPQYSINKKGIIAFKQEPN